MGLGGIGGGPNINNIQGASNQFESQKTGQSQTPAETLASRNVREELLNKSNADFKPDVKAATEGVKQALADGSGAPIPAGTDKSALFFPVTPGVVKNAANTLQSKQNPTLADASTLTTALAALAGANKGKE